MAIRVFLLIFGLFWTAITGVFLVMALTGLVNQIRARSFATAPGVIDSIATFEEHGSENSTSTGVKVRYQFQAQGRTCTGQRVRFNQGSTSGPWPTDMVRRFPAGSTQTVYYNRANPAESVLLPGVQSEDLLLLMFLTPFTVVMVGLWAGFWQTFRRSEGFRGLRVIDEGARTRIRTSGWMAVGIGGIALAGAAFVASFIVAFGFGGIHAPFPTAVAICTIVLASGVVAALAAARSIFSDSAGILLDDFSRTLSAPKGLCVDYKEISAIRVNDRAEASSDGNTLHVYEVWLDYSRGNEEKSERLQKWTGTRADADRFAKWLREKLGIRTAEASGKASSGTN